MSYDKITQIGLIKEISQSLKKFGIDKMSVRQINAIINAANQIMAALEAKDEDAKEGIGLTSWLASSDTGLSSKYLASVVWGFIAENYYPSDPSDFGRCYRLLRAVPGTREKLFLLSDKSPQWKVLVENWDELERLYEQQRKDEEKKKNRKHVCWDKMQELFESIKKESAK